jgi:hypothetical protein
MHAIVQLKKTITGRDSQGMYRQNELVVGQTASRKVTLTLSVVALLEIEAVNSG